MITTVIRPRTVKFNPDQTIAELQVALGTLQRGEGYVDAANSARVVLSVLQVKYEELPAYWRSASPSAWLEALFCAYEALSIVTRERRQTQNIAISASLAAWNIAQRGDVGFIRRRKCAMNHLLVLAASSSLKELGHRLLGWQELPVADECSAYDSIEFGIRVHNYLSGLHDFDAAIELAESLTIRAERNDLPGLAGALNSAMANLYVRNGTPRPDLVVKAHDLIQQAPFPTIHYYYWLCQDAILAAHDSNMKLARDRLAEAENLASYHGFTYSAVVNAREHLANVGKTP